MRDAPLLHRNCLLDRSVARLAAHCAMLLATAPAASWAQTSASFPVGLRQLEYVADGQRHLAVSMFYPATVRARWFAEFLAARGYSVAALNHYRANTYDSTIAYLANKLWQRPRDINLTISFLLHDAFWGGLIDESRI